MKAVRVITGSGLPLRRSDVDTDQIIPAEWLKRIERTGFEQGLFATWRDDRDFVLNDERFAGASVLVAGPAFGVGSSREHAVWAIQQYGFDAVIAPSFSDIFRNNCTKNGLVPVVLPEPAVRRIWDAIESDPATSIVVDVERLVVEVPAIGLTEAFPLDPTTQHRFLGGLDDIGLTLAHAAAIDEFESRRPSWLSAAPSPRRPAWAFGAEFVPQPPSGWPQFRIWDSARPDRRVHCHRRPVDAGRDQVAGGAGGVISTSGRSTVWMNPLALGTSGRVIVAPLIVPATGSTTSTSPLSVTNGPGVVNNVATSTVPLIVLALTN
jgi:3-isopropylmalate/(R)-2-methylmalate dehydratase small subunit